MFCAALNLFFSGTRNGLQNCMKFYEKISIQKIHAQHIRVIDMNQISHNPSKTKASL